MRKEKRIIIIFIFIALLINCKVYAHPGRTDSHGCHTCRTNCAKWGLRQGEYHCHNGGSSSSNNTPNPTPYTKSNVATLSTIKIDDNEISIGDEMEFITTNPTPTIVTNSTSNKASVNVVKNDELQYGENVIRIVVIAEDGTKKEYKLNITLVSNDATLGFIKINNKDLEINDEMYFSTKNDKVSVIAGANNKNAKVLYDETYKLDIGDNRMTIKVVAEDGITSKEYVINIKRELVLSDNVGITMYVNGEKVNFKDYKSDKIYISHNISRINIEYELLDNKSKIDLDYEKDIGVGDKTIKFKVIAESGKKQEYTVNIHRYGQIEEIGYTVLGIGVLGGIGFGGYKSSKKLKTKLMKNKKSY